MENVVAEGHSARLSQNLKATANMKNTALRYAKVYTDDGFWNNGELPDGYDIVDFAHSGFSEIEEAAGAEYLSLLVVSENTHTKEKIDESVRQSGFNIAAQLAFETLAIT